MPDPIIIEGVKYLTSKQASRVSGYARDYIGQLCRQGKLVGKVVDRTLFVTVDSLAQYVPELGPAIYEQARKVEKEKLQASTVSHGVQQGYQSTRSDEISLNNNVLGKNISAKNSLTYLRDESPLMPLTGKNVKKSVTDSVKAYEAPVKTSPASHAANIPSLGELIVSQKIKPEVVNVGVQKHTAERLNQQVGVRHARPLAYAVLSVLLMVGIVSAPARAAWGVVMGTQSIDEAKSLISDAVSYALTTTNKGLHIVAAGLTHFDYQTITQSIHTAAALTSTSGFDRFAKNFYCQVQGLWGDDCDTASSSQKENTSSASLAVAPQPISAPSLSPKATSTSTPRLAVKSAPATNSIVSATVSKPTTQVITRVIPATAPSVVYTVRDSGVSRDELAAAMEQLRQEMALSMDHISRQTNRLYDHVADVRGENNDSSSSSNTESSSGTFTSDVSVGGALTVSGGATISGNASFDAGTLSVDATNHRVGIGTSSPTDTLSVAGPLYIAESSPTYQINRLYNQGGQLYWNGMSLGGGGGGTDGNFAFFNNSGLRLATTSNQVVLGASGTSTLATLEVHGTTYVTGTSTSAGADIGALHFGSDYLTDLTGSGLNITANALTLDTSGNWTGTLGTYTAAQLIAAGFSTTSADAWDATKNRWATTSSDYYLGTKSTTNLAEGSNLYYTTTRFDNRLSATTSLPNITTLANLSLPATQLTSFGVPFYTFFNATTTDALTQGSVNKYYADSLVNTYIHGSSTIPKTYANNVFTGANIFSSIVVSGSSLLQGVTATGVNTTNATSTNATTTFLAVTGTASTSNLVISGLMGASTRCLQIAADGTVSANASACGSGAGGGAGTWSTTTSSVAGQYTNYPNNNTDIVTIGNTSTTTAPYWFDPNTAIASLRGKVGIGTSSPYAALAVNGEVVGSYFSATSTTATSTLPLANITTALRFGADYLTDITGSGLNITANALTLDTSGNWTGTLGTYTAAQLIAAGFSTTSADYYVHSSTTIPKTYTANTFTNTQTFNGGLTVGSLNGVLLGTNGVVSSLATSSLGLLTTDVAEGTNLYYTTTRFDNRLSATTSLPNITTLANLSLPATQLTSFGVPFYTFFAATTTDALTQGSVNKYYADSLVNTYIHASTTIPKTYTTNTFTNANTFSSTLTLTGLNGPLDARNGVVGATSSVGVLYGGTGATTFPQGWLYSSGGTTALAASTSPTVAYITATSTTATSTFYGDVVHTGILSIAAPTASIGGSRGTLQIANDTSGAIRPGILSTGNGTSLATYANGSDDTSNIAGMYSRSVFSHTLTVGATSYGNANNTGTKAGMLNFSSGSAIDAVLSRSTTNTLLISSNGSTGAAHLLVNGNASIGTSTLYAKLTAWADTTTGKIFEAVTTASTSALSVSATGFATTTVTGLTINGSATTTSNVGFNISAGCYAINNTCLSAGGASQWTTTGNDIYYNTGNVGIGSSTAWATLAVNPVAGASNQFVVGSSSATSFIINNTGLVGLNGTTTPAALLSINETAGQHAFMVGSSTATKFIIDKNGNVAIGSGNPNGQALNVTGGTANFSSTVAVGGFLYAGTVVGAQSASSNITIDSNSSATKGNVLIQPTNGNVGIGSSTPYAKLSIAATAATTSFMIGSTTSTYFIVDPYGRVGIGTTTPTATLAVNGDVTLSAGSAYRYNGFIVAQASTTLDNYFFGRAGNLTATGISNTGVGVSSLSANTTGYENTAVGYNALRDNQGGYDNNAFGYRALAVNTSGTDNNAMGSSALARNLGGGQNNAVGSYSLNQVTSGSENTANGYNSLAYLTTGFYNTALGATAGNGTLPDNRSVIDQYMTFLGHNSSRDIRIASTTEMDYGTAIGYGSRVGCSNCMALGGTGTFGTNVGIGTSTPLAKLDVVGTNNGTVPLFQVSSLSSFATSTQFIINSAGKVGVGTSTPVSTVSIQGSLCVRDTGSCGTTAGTIYATTATITGIDLAENYQTTDASLVAGEVVSVDPEHPSFIKRADRSTTATVLGIVSTAPGLILGNEIQGVRRPVALAGRVPLKVNAEGGDIRIGDHLALSSVPGVAMRATQSGVTVAIALESFQASAGSGTIEAFVSVAHHTSADDLAVDVNTPPHVDIPPVVVPPVSTSTIPQTFDFSTLAELSIPGTLYGHAFVVAASSSSITENHALSTDQADTLLETLRSITISRYRYAEEPRSALTHMGVLAEGAPSEILSADGKGIDLHKMASLTLVGVQTLDRRVQALEERIHILEMASSTPSTSMLADTIEAVFQQSLNRTLAAVGVSVGTSTVSLPTTDAKMLTVGSQARPTGITLYDENDGKPYCVKMLRGILVQRAGICLPNTADDSDPVPVPPPAPAPIESTSTPPLPSVPEPQPVPDEVSTSTPPVEPVTPPVEPSPAPAPTPAPAPAVVPEPPVEPPPAPSTPPVEPVVNTPPTPEPAPAPEPTPAPAPEPAAATPSPGQ